MEILNDYTKNSVEADRCMAQIVTVDMLSPIEGALNIELANVLGWQCVVKKNDFKVGDLAIYFSIDSVLDASHHIFSFLKGKKIKTKKILGTLSQGLLGSLSWLTDYDKSVDNIKLGDDVTKLLNVRKFVMTAELQQYNDLVDAKRQFPSFCPKTDEQRVQNIPKILQELAGKDVIITRKEDGTSTTYIYCKNKSEDDSVNEIFLICGRNRILTRSNSSDVTSGNQYFEMADKFDIENKMRKLGINIAIQGETVGNKINGNRLKLKENDFRVFNIWDIDNQYYLKWEDVEKITKLLSLNSVPLIYRGPFKSEWTSVPILLEMANKIEYNKGILAEGFIVKTNYGKEQQRHSFKVISNKYLLKHDL